MTKFPVTDSPKQYDRWVYIVLKVTLFAVPALVTLTFLFSFNKIWAIAALALGFLICTTLIIIKGAITGNRYAQGAKKRRSRWFSFMFREDEGLEDEAFKNLWGKK